LGLYYLLIFGRNPRLHFYIISKIEIIIIQKSIRVTKTIIISKVLSLVRSVFLNMLSTVGAFSALTRSDDEYAE